ncbi:hypothetical protein B296_00006657 [Ensete ventricosum]|uniref:Uncharacterized protein n=1 Tax=Ensete ventricosum TaxID=4639 RepID=A0A427B6U6_ENSVE|nr:hypothetical protein B296_00006657 [Ensete ventricosum]
MHEVPHRLIEAADTPPPHRGGGYRSPHAANATSTRSSRHLMRGSSLCHTKAAPQRQVATARVAAVAHNGEGKKSLWHSF